MAKKKISSPSTVATTKEPLSARFYATSKGNEPVRAWLKELSDAERKIIGDDIRTVQVGWPLGMPLVEKLEKDLWEVRSKTPDGWARTLFTVVDEEMVLLHGFMKKTNKIPQQDLELARERMKKI